MAVGLVNRKKHFWEFKNIIAYVDFWFGLGIIVTTIIYFLFLGTFWNIGHAGTD